ncbi:MAG: outer membrane lipid asymmetry maintenance protein MlaD [Rhizomicrobium sp.]|jgi:phospholipid/cholesterol/gamma-HCH transport system substrate-binding protein
MQHNTFETLIGIVVVASFAALFYFIYASTGQAGINGYQVTASFSSVDGVSPGTDVRLNGIKIGTVSSMTLDPRNYEAVVHLTIRGDVQLPDDSSIKITQAGLLGANYLAVNPGGSDRMLASGGVITNTQGSIDLMGLLGRFIYGNSGGK